VLVFNDLLCVAYLLCLLLILVRFVVVYDCCYCIIWYLLGCCLRFVYGLRV